MPDYAGLPPIPKTAAADTTGKNPGNYTALYAASDFNAYVPYIEVPRIVITGGVILTQVKVYAAGQLFTTANIGFNGITVWSARNPMLLNPGNEVWLLFAIAVSGNTAPQVVLWPRYDTLLPANQDAAQ